MCSVTRSAARPAPSTPAAEAAPVTIDHRQAARAGEALRSFLATPLDRLLDRADGQQDPAAEALALFRDVAASVPAYRAFLGEQGIAPERIRSAQDFATLPLVTKQNYL